MDAMKLVLRLLLFFMTAILYSHCYGMVTVADMKENKIIYQKHLPLDFKNPWHRKHGAWARASISLAGKHLYIMDSAGCIAGPRTGS